MLRQLLHFLVFISVVFANPYESVSVKITNLAGKPIEMFWVNTFSPDRELIPQFTAPLRNGTDSIINSFDTHQFQIQFSSHRPGTETIFTKGPREETLYVTWDSSNQKLVAKITTKEDEIRETVEKLIGTCRSSSSDEESLTKCISAATQSQLLDLHDRKARLIRYRDKMSNRLRNYTCADDTLETLPSPPLYSTSHSVQGRDWEVEVLLDQPHAQIWLVRDLVSEEECETLVGQGRGRLRRATVAAEDGSSVVSESRRAQQASYDMPKDKRKDPLGSLYMRVLNIVSTHSPHLSHLQPEGQEEFTIIQYNPGDEYTPHCDGQCDGERGTDKGRVATAVLYCQVAERGGGTSFTKADVFVRPEAGSAVFFTYKGEDGRMDEGYTEHSSCPVLEGEKWISTIWLRDGVSLEEPWDMFDPQGGRILPPRSEEEEERKENLNQNKRRHTMEQRGIKGLKSRGERTNDEL